MDRLISPEERKKEQRKQIIRYAIVVSMVSGAMIGLFSLMQTTVSRGQLQLAAVNRGTIEVSVSASGKVVPAFEEIINSPILSQIVEVYKRGGDSVDVGTPILKLDLQSAENNYRKQLDEEQMKVLQLEQQRVMNHNRISEMEMNLKVSRMTLDRKAVELRNERYLDSLGAGTTDKVLQVELDYNVSRLKLEEEEQKCRNERSLVEADFKVKELELNLFRKSLAETRRILENARICSPRKAILTYVNHEIGAQVAQGARVAVVSDLSHFKVEGEIADSYGDRIATGRRALIKIGKEWLEGMVSDVTPLSRNGVISFSVQLKENNHARLRSGLKTDLYVMESIRDDILRLPNGPYYMGRGEYELFVVEDNHLVKRLVQLGDSNYEFVEVTGGLKEGDEVVVSNVDEYKSKKKLKIEQ